VDLGADHLQRAVIAQDFQALNRRQNGVEAGCEGNAHRVPPSLVIVQFDMAITVAEVGHATKLPPR